MPDKEDPKAKPEADVKALTTEELEATEPPQALTARWPDLLALLRTLDGVRFLPGDGSVNARKREQAAAAIREAQALLADLTPRDSWR